MGKTDIGPPDFWDMLPDAIQRNYGTWKYHERVCPGVLKHVSESGEHFTQYVQAQLDFSVLILSEIFAI